MNHFMDPGTSQDFFEDYFRSTLSSLAEGLLILDGGGVIRACNSKAEFILAKKRDDLLGQSPAGAGIRLIDEDGQPLEPDQFPSALTIENGRTFSNVVVGNQHPEDRIVWMSVNTLPLFRKGYKEPFAIVLTFVDVTSRKNAEERLILQTRLLELLNQSRDPADSLREILSHIRNFSDIEAVAIRLRRANDFPYYETIGFPDDFVEAERYLCLHDERGDLCHDHQGHPLLACVCGLVVRGRTDNRFPFYTANGSFWTNCVSQLIEEFTEEDLRTRVRGRCVGYGYESIALIPLRTGDETVGLLQLNDHRRNRFTSESIAFFEQLSVNLAVAFRRMVAEDELRRQQAELARLVQEQAATNRKLEREIERHRETTTRLEEGRNLLRQVLDAVPSCIFIVDNDSRFLLTNRAAADMYGTTPEALEGKTLPEAVAVDVFQPAEWEELVRINREVIRSRQPFYQPEFSFTQPGKEPRYFHSVKIPLDWDGSPDCLLGVTVDVTEQRKANEALRRHQEQLEERVAERTTDLSRINAHLVAEINNRIRTEEELRRSEARFRGLFEDSPIGLMEIDISNLLAAIIRLKQQGVTDFKAWFREHPEIIREAEIIDTNKAALEIYGARNKDDLLGSLARLQCEESGDSALREFLTLVKGGTRFQGSTVNRRLDGRKIHIVFSWTVAPGFETNRTRVLASIIDVTENRALEQSLRMNEALLHSMATTAPLAYYVVDNRTGDILFYNPQFCHLWRLEHHLDDLLAGKLKNPGVVDLVLPLMVDPEGFIASSLRLRNEENKAIIDDEVHLIDGRTIRRLSSQILDPNGAYLARIYIFEDITNRKQSEIERLESEQRYRDLFELAPVALWEEDFSEVKRAIDTLKEEGVHDFPAYFRAHPEVVRDMMSRVKILDVNQATLNMCRASDRSQLLANIHKLFTEQSYNEFTRELTAIAREETFLEFELPAMNLAGEKVDALLTWAIAPGHEAEYDKGYVSVMDITARKQAETARLESERRYRNLFEMAPWPCGRRIFPRSRHPSRP